MSMVTNGFRSKWLYASTELVGGMLVGRWIVDWAGRMTGWIKRL